MFGRFLTPRIMSKQLRVDPTVSASVFLQRLKENNAQTIQNKEESFLQLIQCQKATIASVLV